MSGIFKRTRLPRYGAKAVYTNSSGKPAAVSLNIQGTDETKTSTYSIKITDELQTEGSLNISAQINSGTSYPKVGNVYKLENDEDGALGDLTYIQNNRIDPVSITSDGTKVSSSSSNCFHFNEKHKKCYCCCDAPWCVSSQCHRCNGCFNGQWDNSKNIENVNWSLDSVKKHMTTVKRVNGHMKVEGLPYYCTYSVASLSNIKKGNLFEAKYSPSSACLAGGTYSLCNHMKATCCRPTSSSSEGMGWNAAVDNWSTSSHAIAITAMGSSNCCHCWFAKWDDINCTGQQTATNAGCAAGTLNQLICYQTCYSTTGPNPSVSGYSCCADVYCCAAQVVHPSQKHSFAGCDLLMFAEARHNYPTASSPCTVFGVYSSYLSSNALDFNCYSRNCCRLHQSMSGNFCSCCGFPVTMCLHPARLPAVGRARGFARPIQPAPQMATSSARRDVKIDHWPWIFPSLLELDGIVMAIDRTKPTM